MKQSNNFIGDMLDFDLPEAADDVFWLGGRPTAVRAENGAAVITIPFQAQTRPKLNPDPSQAPKSYDLIVRAYGEKIVRCSISFGSDFPEDDTNVMMEWHPALKQEPLEVRPAQRLGHS